jgi:glycosyltransferase involved in cell wall biosynthesis
MADNMTIAYLCPDVGVPVLGFKGCSVHVREMCSALAGLGADVSIYALSKGEGNRYPHVITEVNHFKRKCMGRDLRLVLSNMKLYWTCRKQFRVRKPHFIYERYGLYGWAGVKLAREFSIPLIMEVNCLLAEKEKNRLHFSRLARSFETLILRRANAICCPSRVMKSLLVEREIAGEKILVTPNGISLEKFDTSLDGREIRRRYGLEGKVVVGFVGSLRDFLGVYTILESARHVLSQRKDFHFMVVGKGRAFSDMDEYIRENSLADGFILTGGVPHSDIPRYIAAMDIGLAPYGHREPFYGSAMKVFEYMAMAKPVIASAQGQIKDIIKHGENGLLIEPDDSDGLTRAILKLGGDKSMMKNMGLKARATVERSYTWEANARKVLAIYESLTEGEITPDYEK